MTWPVSCQSAARPLRHQIPYVFHNTTLKALKQLFYPGLLSGCSYVNKLWFVCLDTNRFRNNTLLWNRMSAEWIPKTENRNALKEAKHYHIHRQYQQVQIQKKEFV